MGVVTPYKYTPFCSLLQNQTVFKSVFLNAILDIHSINHCFVGIKVQYSTPTEECLCWKTK